MIIISLGHYKGDMHISFGFIYFFINNLDKARKFYQHEIEKK